MAAHGYGSGCSQSCPTTAGLSAERQSGVSSAALDAATPSLDGVNGEKTGVERRRRRSIDVTVFKARTAAHTPYFLTGGEGGLMKNEVRGGKMSERVKNQISFRKKGVKAGRKHETFL